MSQILNTARNLMAVMQPATGTRASGPVTITAESGDVSLPRNTFAMPVIEGRRRPDLLLKVDEGPNDDSSWTITTSGTEVTFISNIGGVRQNIPVDTPIHFDPPIDGLVSAAPTVDTTFTGGTDMDGFAPVKDMVIYEHFDGPSFQIDLRRSGVTLFPCVIIAWQNTEPADGATITQTDRPTRTGTRGVLYKDTFTVSIVSSRDESDHSRRHEGLEIVDTLTRLLTDKQMVDRWSFSAPGGVQIRQFFREDGPEDVYQKFYIYTIQLSTERELKQLDSRTYNDWLLAVMNIYKPQDPVLPDQGDFTIVEDMEIDMS
jgi:hypothetical protein